MDTPNWQGNITYEAKAPGGTLTQAERDRVLRLAEKVKRREIGRATIDLHAKNGGLYIVGWQKAA